MLKDSVASRISDMVNKISFYPTEVGIELTTDHRYLVGQEFQCFLAFIGQLSINYDKGFYDARNEFACKCSKVITDALKEKGLYDVEFYKNNYEEILKKCFE